MWREMQYRRWRNGVTADENNVMHKINLNGGGAQLAMA